MFKKKHLVLTALCTAVAVVFVYNIVVMSYINKHYASDPVIKARDIIATNYVNKPTEEEIAKMNDDAIEAMVAGLNDPYSRYMDMTAFSDYEDSNEENYVGLGMQVSFDALKEVIVVMSPYDNSPAQKGGILPGDAIIEVDGMKVSKDTYEDIVSHISGDGAKEGDAVKMKVLHKDAKEPVEIELKREKVDIQTITCKMIDDIGYIRVSEFRNITESEFKKALETVKESKASSLIIDLRNNPGGYAHTVLSMCDMLLPEGVIAYLEDNEGERQYFNSDKEEIGIPMAILINGGTASASELLAGSVQAYSLATIVGEKSFGKAVGQSPYRLTADTAIYLTNARYFTPKGNCIDGVGIMPDIEVKLSDEKLSKLTLLKTEEDDQLLAAIDALKNKK